MTETYYILTVGGDRHHRRLGLEEGEIIYEGYNESDLKKHLDNCNDKPYRLVVLNVNNDGVSIGSERTDGSSDGVDLSKKETQSLVKLLGGGN